MKTKNSQMKTFNPILKPILFMAIVLFISSCLDDKETEVPRTEADELQELNTFLLQLEAEDFDIDTTALGLYYINIKDGTGPVPLAGDSISVKYIGYFMDGYPFDSSYKSETDTTLNFRYKEFRLVEGFEDGISLMNKGSEITMIIRSSLGYGPYDYYTIPGYSTIIFDVELVDIFED